MVIASAVFSFFGSNSNDTSAIGCFRNVTLNAIKKRGAPAKFMFN